MLSLCQSVTCVCLSPIVEIATLTREDGKTKIKVLKQKEVEQLIKRHEAEEAKAEKDKKEKEQKEKDKWAQKYIIPSCHPILYYFVFYIKSFENKHIAVVVLWTDNKLTYALQLYLWNGFKISINYFCILTFYV